jgi:hypothetical protein
MVMRGGDLRHARQGDAVNGMPGPLRRAWRAGDAERERAVRAAVAAIRERVAREYAAELEVARG